MSRKIFFPGSAEPAKPADAQEPLPVPQPAPRLDPLRMRPLMATPAAAAPQAAPVGAISASLSHLSARGKHADDIERELAKGVSVIELDPALVEPSFVADRMPLTDEALSDLVEAIKNNTQLSPILVRPHPEKQGHYQSAFGHRRTRAAKLLGIKVRAIVRNLSDEEMVVAQGQENHARKDLSYIEKARFAARLEERFSRETIMQALSVYKSDLSYMLSVAHRIPEEITAAIGPAPKTGRRGWIELADLLRASRLIDLAKEATRDPIFPTRESDERFKLVRDAVKTKPPRAKTEVWSSDGKKLGRVVANAQKVTLSIDRKLSPDFAEFVLTRVKSLYAEFKKAEGG